MSNLAEKGSRKRSTPGKWPELPEMPARLKNDPDMREWNAQLQQMWANLRIQLNLMEDNLRTTITEATAE